MIDEQFDIELEKERIENSKNYVDSEEFKKFKKMYFLFTNEVAIFAQKLNNETYFINNSYYLTFVDGKYKLF